MILLVKVRNMMLKLQDIVKEEKVRAAGKAKELWGRLKIVMVTRKRLRRLTE